MEWFPLIFFVVAIVYSSVGFGGGSTYLAILMLGGLGVADAKAMALLCNLIVVLGSMIQFQRKGLVVWQSLAPLLLFSIPCAFIGGRMKVSEDTFVIIVGVVLIVAAVSLLLRKDIVEKPVSNNKWMDGLSGGIIGFVSGFIGIGGGIFLSPLLYFRNWGMPKQISAAATTFIFFNSISGFVGLLTLEPAINWQLFIFIGFAVLIGGQIGNKLNINYIPPRKIQWITGLLVGIVGLRLVFF